MCGTWLPLCINPIVLCVHLQFDQEYPVTPYQIKITTHQDRQYYYRVCVDGVKVKGLVLKNKEFA